MPLVHRLCSSTREPCYRPGTKPHDRSNPTPNLRLSRGSCRPLPVVRFYQCRLPVNCELTMSQTSRIHLPRAHMRFAGTERWSESMNAIGGPKIGAAQRRVRGSGCAVHFVSPEDLRQAGVATYRAPRQQVENPHRQASSCPRSPALQRKRGAHSEAHAVMVIPGEEGRRACRCALFHGEWKPPGVSCSAPLGRPDPLYCEPVLVARRGEVQPARLGPRVP